jgi:hypothetical protein
MNLKRLISFLTVGVLLFTAGSALTESMYVNVRPLSDLNVRTGPGYTFDVVGHLFRGARVDVVSKAGGWAQIDYKGETAYLDLSFLTSLKIGGSGGLTAYATLRSGASGNAVKTLQNNLNTIGKSHAGIPALTVDGRFGPKTKAAVIAFQKLFSLAQDGVVGPKTWSKIIELR